MREAQMTWSVSGEAGNASSLCNALDGFGPHDEGERRAWVPSRFGEKQGTSFDTELTALLEIGFQKMAGHAAVAHNAFRFIFCMLSANADLPVRKVKIGDLKPHQFFTAKRPIVRKKQHDLIPELHAFPRNVFPATNGVIWTNLFLDEIIMVEANHCEPLLHGSARKPTPRANGENIGTSRIGPCGEILDVKRQ